MQGYDPLIDTLLYWFYFIVLILVIIGLGAKALEETPSNKPYDPTDT